ncbi:TusE/DsrC/DsvC family sulfur relay protein [Aquirhabdus parva]|uniref:TusE/DsrC/DsvC family sulfur relay protein n=1 Tax=Aquirhabdus parva TaxID=2283318 RepID=UPI003898EEC1
MALLNRMKDKGISKDQLTQELILPIEIPTVDSDGHLINHLEWTPEVAHLLAAHDDLVLTEVHLQVLFAMRIFYQRFEHAPATRPLIKFLLQSIGPEMTNAHLMALFNTGLVARTLARLSGLPKPANCL